MASKALSNARSMAVGFLAVATVMLMISADKFLNMIDLTSGSLRIGARVCAAFSDFLDFIFECIIFTRACRVDMGL